MEGVLYRRCSVLLTAAVFLLPQIAVTVRIGDSGDDSKVALTATNVSGIDPGLLEEDEDLAGFTNLATNFKYPPETAKKLRQLLAAAAADVYDLKRTPFIGEPDDDILTMLSCQEQDAVSTHAVRWASYLISKKNPWVPEEFRGQRILAFRGTDGKRDLATDLSLMGFHNPWSSFSTASQYGITIAGKRKPHFVSGHSLGGAVAEVVALAHKIPGASWNGPSVCTRNPVANHCGSLSEAKKTADDAKHQFEIWLTNEDPVSTLSVFTMKTEDAHTNTPHFVSCPKKAQDALKCNSGLAPHSMECMIDLTIGNLPTAAGCTGGEVAQQCGGAKLAPNWAPIR